MTGSILSGFLIGLLGSLHCVGMCGPLVLLIPSSQKGRKKSFLDVIIYHLGRISFYSILGLFVGLIGMSLVVFISLQWLSIVLGILMLLLAWFRLRKGDFFNNSIGAYVTKKLSVLYQKIRTEPNPFLLFGAGFLNGMLPCGFVYFGMLNSLASNGILGGVLSMTAFGLGTLPILLIFSFTLGKWKLGFSYQKAIPYLLTITALLMILRGLNLGIPILSPKIELIQSDGHAVPKIECCENPANNGK